MRAILATVALAASTALLAEGPKDFRSTAPVTLTQPDALQRFVLPFEAYRDGRRDLADLRVFNASGEALPIAFAGEEPAAREAPPLAPLPLFAVAGAERQAARSGDLDVTVRSNADGTIVSVQGRTRGALSTPPAQPVAWLADASQLQRPVRGMVVEWDAGPGTEIAKLDVEASDDLKSWRTLATRAPVLQLGEAPQRLVQPRVEWPAQRAKYLRITAQPAGFRLRAVLAVMDEVARPVPRSLRRIEGTAGTKPGEYLFDVGARLPVDALRVVLPAQNSVAPFAVSSRDGASGPWGAVTGATFYRLVRDGVEIESPPVEIPRRAARYWSIQLDPRSPGIGTAVPSLEVQWRPAQVVFVARGEAPFTLAFGNAEARPARLSVSELIPGYETRAELKLPEAKVGEVRSNGDAYPWAAWFGDVPARRLVLWAILVLAVAALGGMAWRLKRQIVVAREAPPRE
ncbi:MAG: DUF3999 domain-containing protein [Usitatibacter sp.]